MSICLTIFFRYNILIIEGDKYEKQQDNQIPAKDQDG